MALAGEAQDPVEARDLVLGLQQHDAVLSVEETPQCADRHAHVPAENLLGPGEESSGETPATCNPAEGTFVLARSKSDSELMDSNDTVSVRDVLELYNRFHESTQRTQRDIRVRAKLEDWLVPRDSIQFGAELGRGSGGIVYQARWRGLQCAAKTLHYETCVSRQYDRTCAAAESNSRKDLMNELTVLSRLRHPNLVLFLGACFGGDELIVLSEFIENGNFEQYVESCKGSVICPSPARLRLSFSFIRANDSAPTHSVWRWVYALALGLILSLPRWGASPLGRGLMGRSTGPSR
jgi:hypothetical protein